MYKKLVILLLMSTLFGFNIIQFIEKQRTKRWERSDIVYSLFSNEKGNHSVYSRLSDKPKIVFLHGFGASSLLQWYDVARLLKNDYDLIMPDLLCSGESAVIDNDYTVDAQVEHVKFVIEQLGVKEKVIVCGNSYGGLVASHFADKYPEMVSHLIMYDAPSKHYSLQHADSVARSLGLTQTTILKYLNDGTIKAVKIGKTWYISEIALREYLGIPCYHYTLLILWAGEHVYHNTCTL